MSLTITGNVTAKKGHSEEIKAELLKLIDITRKEEGCLQYDLHQDNDNENFFLFFENWENRELWQKHMNASHIAQYLEATKDIQEDFFVKELTLVK